MVQLYSIIVVDIHHSMHGEGLWEMLTVLFPEWFMNNNFHWYLNDKISIHEFVTAGNWLINNVTDYRSGILS